MVRAAMQLSNLCLALCFGAAVAAVAPDALAGELKVLAAEPEVDGSGKLTGKAESLSEIPSAEGEEIWTIHMWAKIDKGAPGPLYAEFFGDLNGKKYLAQRFEKSDYDGEKYVSWSIELDGNLGFNRDRTYTIELNQLGAKDKSIKLASSKVTLRYTEPAPEEEDEGGGDEAAEEEGGGDDLSEQDVHDSLAGDGGEGGDGPPPVTPATKKKGCSVGASPIGGGGLLAMLVLGAFFRRRRD